MLRLFGLASLVFLISISLLIKAEAYNMKGRCAVSLTCSGVCIKYGVSERLSLEAKLLSERENIVLGVSSFYNILSKQRFNLFVGCGASIVKFKGVYSMGSGWMFETLTGVDLLVDEGIVLSFGVGPIYIKLKDASTTLIEEGVDYIFVPSLSIFF
jgi:hypothetical protein